MARIKFTPGAVLEIPVDSVGRVYGVMCTTSPYIAYYYASKLSDVGPQLEKPLFTVATLKTAYEKGAWGSIIEVLFEDLIPASPKTFMENYNGTYSIMDPSGEKTSATKAELVGLERAAVWSREHIEDRICALLSGETDVWSEQMKLD